MLFSVPKYGGPDEEDRLDVVRRLGLDDDTLGVIRGAGVGVDQDRLEVREVLDEAGMGGSDDVADGGRVLEAGDPDHDVRTPQARDLLADLGGQRGGRHPLDPTTLTRR